MSKEWFIEAHEVLDSYIALDVIAEVIDECINSASNLLDDPFDAAIELELSFEDACTLYDYIKETGIFSKSQM